MKDIKFAIRYIPTKQWVKIWFGISMEGYIHLMDSFHIDMLYAAKNMIEDDLDYAVWGDKRGRIDPKEFEIVEIEVTYKIPD